ncbi:uncharacterized protein LOC135245797 isoform X1 [Anguilla rostrata]|uniref:uncharacterized protein LOC135245797 isoform X1 n=1 Tax=Anguilla rostrata TaxID=7938 RepID=UPI0030CDBE29
MRTPFLPTEIWITACVGILLYTTFAACSRGTGSQRIDDEERISLLKQNIPKNYKIPVRFVPRNTSGMCWVELNTFPLEESLKALASTFGNVSSNRIDINTFIYRLQNVRYRIQATMETTMEDFKCHYRREEWPTEDFFDYVRDFLSVAESKEAGEGGEECESAPCATAAPAAPTQLPAEGPSTTSPVKVADCLPASDCQTRVERQYLPEDAQKGLLSLFLVSVAANICLLIWMVRGRRQRGPERNAESGRLFLAAEENRPPSNHGTSEKNRLNAVNAI